jgi:hypothetical protein
MLLVPARTNTLNGRSFAPPEAETLVSMIKKMDAITLLMQPDLVKKVLLLTWRSVNRREIVRLAVGDLI